MKEGSFQRPAGRPRLLGPNPFYRKLTEKGFFGPPFLQACFCIKRRKSKPVLFDSLFDLDDRQS